jgi:CRISPR/Cas system-associated exonuclease Cas4 (RecB family)
MFLLQLAQAYQSYLNAHPQATVMVLLPNRRSQLFFLRTLGQYTNMPLWAPITHQLDDWLTNDQRFQQADGLRLMIELFQVFRQLNEGASLATFWPIGRAMLTDFDAIDRYQVQTDKLFMSVSEWHEMDPIAWQSNADWERIQQFWASFGQRANASRTRFLSLWQELPKLYHAFRQRLSDQGLAYRGMVMRDQVQQLMALKGIDLKAAIGADLVLVAAPVDAPTPVLHLLEHLHEQQLATLFWDAHNGYWHQHPATTGLNRLWRRIQPPIDAKQAPEELPLPPFPIYAGPEVITTFEAPLAVAQCQALGELLADLAPSEWEQTAVVLSDAGLLFDVLAVLPPDCRFNITMSFPLQATPVAALLKQLMALYQHALHNPTQSGVVRFRGEDMLQLLANPLMDVAPYSDLLAHLHSVAAKNDKAYLFIELEQLPDSFQALPEIQHLFQPIADGLTWLLHLSRLIESLYEPYLNDQRQYSLTAEYLYHAYQTAQRLYNALSELHTLVDFDTLATLMQSALFEAQLPFTGEPLEGLQIITPEQTLHLNFKHVYWLSLNEGVYPAENPAPTLLPFTLRQGFGLPTLVNNDEYPSYLFYRLLQTATYFTGFYVGMGSGKSKGEPSRYLQQLRYMPPLRLNEKAVFIERSIQFSGHIPSVEPIIITKTPKVLAQLTRHIQQKGLSATQLEKYLECGLRFYLRFIEGLTDDQVTDQPIINVQVIGKMVHQVIEVLYMPYVGQEVDHNIIGQLKTQVGAVAWAVAEEHHAYLPPELKPRLALQVEIITTYVQQFLDLDIVYSPFMLIGLELPYTHVMDWDGQVVKLTGVYDRVQERNGAIEIIDYKTGALSPLKQLDVEAVFSPRNELKNYGSDSKAIRLMLQGYMYAYTYQLSQPQQDIDVIFYAVSEEQGQRIHLLSDTKGNGVFLMDSHYQAVDAMLQQIVQEMLDEQVPFVQTEKVELCKYCGFQALCHRVNE